MDKTKRLYLRALDYQSLNIPVRVPRPEYCWTLLSLEALHQTRCPREGSSSSIPLLDVLLKIIQHNGKYIALLVTNKYVYVTKYRREILEL